jgi:PEGA domain
MPSSLMRARSLVAAAVLPLLWQAVAPGVAVAEPPKAAPSLAEATAIRAGEVALVAKKWADAEAAFASALKLTRTERALFGLASAEYELGFYGKAYDHFEDYLNTFGAKAAPARKLVASQRLAELVQKTGLLSLNASAAGAEIFVDDVLMATTPLSKPLRLAKGPHRLRVVKTDMAPWSAAPTIPEGGLVSLAVALAPASTKGHVVVTEASGKPVQVLVDGTEVGPAPWEGDLESGVHEIALRGATLVAEPEKIEVAQGALRAVSLTAVAAAATLKLAISDGVGAIAVDGKALGEGTINETLAPGEHTIRITREGYEPLEKTVTLKPKETLSETLTLKLIANISTDTVEVKVRSLEGVYGALNVGAALSPSGLSATSSALCDPGTGLGAEGCSAGTPLGGELGGHVGYHWNPIGLELALAARYDATTDTVNFNGVGEPSSNRLAVGVARKETYDVYRAGASAVIRSRFTVQSQKLRFSVAGGAGFSHRRMFLVRSSEATDGSGRIDKFSPSGRNYWSPMLSFDAGVSYRASETLALRLGFAMSIENATLLSQTSTRTEADANRFLVKEGQTPAPVVTPAYFVATSGQITTGLYVGLEFGP